MLLRASLRIYATLAITKDAIAEGTRFRNTIYRASCGFSVETWYGPLRPFRPST